MHQENIPKLGANDILIASYPGAGSTWFGSLFVSLSIFYVEGYHERLVDEESQNSVVVEKTRRQHLPILNERDDDSREYKEPIRVIKTHLLPDLFNDVLAKRPEQKALLLVRDGRDTVLSYYHWLKTFANYQGTLKNYLHDYDVSSPANDWAEYNHAWLNKVTSKFIYTISFEKCRADPVNEIQKLLQFLGIERNITEIQHAITLSSYTNMQRLEDDKINTKGEEIGTGRIMRKGKVNGWIDEFSDDDLKTFEGFPNEMLKFFGY